MRTSRDSRNVIATRLAKDLTLQGQPEPDPPDDEDAEIDDDLPPPDDDSLPPPDELGECIHRRMAIDLMIPNRRRAEPAFVE